MLNRIKQLLGRNDKKQAERTRRVVESSDTKKGEFHREMEQLRKQAKHSHLIALKNASESGKLMKVVDDIAAKVAVSSGNFQYEH